MNRRRFSLPVISLESLQEENEPSIRSTPSLVPDDVLTNPQHIFRSTLSNSPPDVSNTTAAICRSTSPVSPLGYPNNIRPFRRRSNSTSALYAFRHIEHESEAKSMFDVRPKSHRDNSVEEIQSSMENLSENESQVWRKSSAINIPIMNYSYKDHGMNGDIIQNKELLMSTDQVLVDTNVGINRDVYTTRAESSSSKNNVKDRSIRTRSCNLQSIITERKKQENRDVFARKPSLPPIGESKPNSCERN